MRIFLVIVFSIMMIVTGCSQAQHQPETKEAKKQDKAVSKNKPAKAVDHAASTAESCTIRLLPANGVYSNGVLMKYTKFDCKDNDPNKQLDQVLGEWYRKYIYYSHYNVDRDNEATNTKQDAEHFVIDLKNSQDNNLNVTSHCEKEAYTFKCLYDAFRDSIEFYKGQATGYERMTGRPLQCDNTENITEITICQNKHLTKLDRKMRKIFMAGYEGGGDVTDKDETWQVRRNSCKSDAKCLEKLYNKRINKLKRLIEWWDLYLE